MFYDTKYLKIIFVKDDNTLNSLSATFLIASESLNLIFEYLSNECVQIIAVQNLWFIMQKNRAKKWK